MPNPIVQHFRDVVYQEEAADNLNVLVGEARLKPAMDVKLRKEVLSPRGIKTLMSSLCIFHQGMYGIEVEFEGPNMKSVMSGAWNTSRDGSLRGDSAEFILNTPLDKTQAIEAFSQLITDMGEAEATFIPSLRTSIHVHVNMLPLTKEQIVSFIYLSFLVEESLVHYSGNSRTGNRFCLRLRDAEERVDVFLKFISKAGWGVISTDQNKYSAINIAPVTKYGSVEFRSLRATTDISILTNWLTALGYIYEIALSTTPLDLFKVAKDNPEQFLDVVFKDVREAFRFDGEIEALNHNRKLLIEVPFTKVR